jgi:predicted nucleotidyltransferase
VISKRTTHSWPLPQAKLDQAIRAMVRRIVDEFDPDRIILFGSRARGDARPDSDVDLLVVMPVEGSTREKAIDIRVALRDIPVPKDIRVVTPESFSWRRNVVGTLECPADREGKVLHARKR